MKCLSCGCTIDDDSVFCSRCGFKIGSPLPEETVPAAEETIADTVSELAEEAAEKVSEPVEAVEKAAEKAEKKAEKLEKKLEKKAEKKAEAAAKEAAKLEKKAESKVEDAEKAVDTFADKLEKKTGSTAETAADIFSEKAESASGIPVDLKKEEPVVDILPEEDPVVTINEALEALNGIRDTDPATAAAAEEVIETVNAPAEPVALAKEEPPVYVPHDIELPEPEDVPVPEFKPEPKAEKVPDAVNEEFGKPEPESTGNFVSDVQQQINGSTPDFGQQAPPPDNGQQPYPQYSAPQQPEPAPEIVRVDRPVKVSALRISFAGFIAFLTIIFLILLSFMFCIKMGASGKLLQKRAENMNISTVLDSTYKHKVKAEGGQASKKVRMNLSDAIYNEAGFGEVTNGEVSKAEFRAYLAKTDLLKYTGEHIKEYADYILEGDKPDPSLSANDLGDFFSNNSDVADENLSYEMQTSDYNKIRTRFELKDTADNFSLDKWSKAVHFNLANSSFLFSYVTLGIILGLIIVLLVWIAVIVDGRGKHIVGLYGGIFKWSGAVVFLVGLAIVAGSSIAHVITGGLVFYLCASLLLPFGLFCMCTGAVEWAFGFIFKRIRRGIRNSDKRNKAVEKALTGANV